MSDHKCHAMGCERPCRPEYLMCGPCWATVPKRIQALVWETYTPGQCDGRAGIRPEWHEAADKAIAAAAIRSGHFTADQAKAWLDRHSRRRARPEPMRRAEQLDDRHASRLPGLDESSSLISEDTPASRIDLINAIEVVTGRTIATKADALDALDELAGAAATLRTEITAW